MSVCGCAEIGPLLVAPGTSGRPWECGECGKVWTHEVDGASLTVHPAALVLADHIAAIGVRAAMSRAACECGWRGAVCDYPAHLADMLDQAGLLADGTPPETPTERVLAERADRRTT